MESANQSLLDIPNEILLLIFHHTHTVSDACHLAQCCSPLYRIFTSQKNKSRILRSAAGVSQDTNYNLEQAFSVLVRESPSKWRVQSASGSSWILVDVDYGLVDEARAASRMWDVTAIRNRAEHLPFQGALHEFLHQFHEFHKRWERGVFPMTEMLLPAAARLQTDILRSLEPPTLVAITDLSSETTVIALALHIFVLVRDIILIDTNVRDVSEAQLFQRESSVTLLPRSDDSDTTSPSARVSQHKTGFILPMAQEQERQACRDDSSLGKLLTCLARLSFQLLHTEDPRHWPTVFFVILILDSIRYTLAMAPEWMVEFKNADSSIGRLFKDLARFYYACTDGGTLLSSNWNPVTYRKRVGDCQIVVEYAGVLRELWEGDGDELIDKQQYPHDQKGIDGFLKKIRWFVYEE
ncbi:hypothetical protein BDW62DRAFT_202631 [Aspergillus aurantiobrunneus]